MFIIPCQVLFSYHMVLPFTNLPVGLWKHSTLKGDLCVHVGVRTDVELITKNEKWLIQ